METGSCFPSCFRQSMPRLRGGQWTSEHCVQKVEEMLSRAIVHQEDLLGLLTSNSGPGESNCNNSAVSLEATSGGSISPPVLRALKAKIENSMDWCHLALCRLREIVLHTSSNYASPKSPSPRSAHGVRLLSSYSKMNDLAAKHHQHHQHHRHQQLVSSSPTLNIPTPLSPLHVLLCKEPLSPHPFTVQNRSTAQWNPGCNLFFTDAAPSASPGEARGEDSSAQQRRRHQQQGQNFARLPAMDTSDWPLLSESTGPLSAGLPPPLLSSAADPRQCSTSSCLINPVVGSFNGGEVTDHIHYKTHAPVAEDQSYNINKTSAPPRANRSRNGSGKSEVRKLSGGEAKLEVVFQKLNDAKKGIPDDGHRGWKKYGNKSIQNSNHCRGYYKCSMKECRAKKMVQPTDKDPTLFEVTYVGKHSCSSTGPRRRSSPSTPVCTPTPVRAPVETPQGQGKSQIAGILMEMEDSSILMGPNSVMEESIGWTGMSILPGSSCIKRGRPVVEDEEKPVSLDNFSYLHTMTTSTTTGASEDAGDASMDTYLQQSSRHHQAVFSFQEPLLWHDFDMDTNLSTGHKSVNMDSDSP